MNQLIDKINNKFKDLSAVSGAEVYELIVEHAEELLIEQSLRSVPEPVKPQGLKGLALSALSSNKIGFGKYRDFTIEELSGTLHGKSYLKWMFRQTWMVEDKFGNLYEQGRKYCPQLVKN